MKLRYIFVAIVAIGCLIIAGTLYWDYRVPNFRNTAEIYIYPETTADETAELIISQADPKSERSLIRCFKSKKVGQFIRPGHYTIEPKHTSIYIARMLNNAWQTPVKLTLAGNLRLKTNIAAKISSQLLLDSASVLAALNDARLLANYGFRPDNVFSLLRPATYQMYWTASIEEFLAKQKQAYEQFWTPERDAAAGKLGLSREEVAILASIVTGESKYTPELPLIAGVYLNRLAIGMPLQADPTICYAYDYQLNRVLRKHLSVDSPYNTYIHRGLPPGPICVPTTESLEAVLNPDYGGARGKGNIFFCADPSFNGSHRFARTLSEHNANARAFQRALNIRAKAK